jgi:hypothetical protein
LIGCCIACIGLLTWHNATFTMQRGRGRQFQIDDDRQGSACDRVGGKGITSFLSRHRDRSHESWMIYSAASHMHALGDISSSAEHLPPPFSPFPPRPYWPCWSSANLDESSTWDLTRFARYSTVSVSCTPSLTPPSSSVPVADHLPTPSRRYRPTEASGAVVPALTDWT